MTFWTSLATYCNELAPVVGPLFSALGETAGAIDRADRESTALSSVPTSHIRILRDRDS